MPTIELPKLHPGQVSVYQRQKRFNVLQCGRRWGKTLFGEVIAAEASTMGQHVGWVSPIYRYLQDAWRDCRRDLRPVITRANEQEKRLELLGGGTIDFWSADSPDPCRGRKYHKVILDECGIMPDLIPIWREAIRPTLTDYRGSAWFMGTPKGRREFHRLYEKGAHGDEGWASFRMPTSSNPAISKEELAAAKRELPEHIYLQEFEGVPCDDSGNPFGLKAIHECFTNVPEKDTKVVAYGVDLARAQDYCVVIGLNESGGVCYFDRWNGIPWGESTARILSAVKGPALIDSTGIGDVIVEDLQRRGNGYIEGFHFSSRSKQNLCEGLASAIQTRSIRFSQDVLRSELEVFEYEYGRTGVKYSAPSGCHDDCVVALGLAWHKLIADRNAPRPFLYVCKDPVIFGKGYDELDDDPMWTTHRPGGW